MPFKIIETLEKGQKTLCIIPSLWESNGNLKWPRKRLDVNKLAKNEKSIPFHNWSTSKCTVKRMSLSSYEVAERELDLMLQNSDTDVDNTIDRSYATPTTHKNNNINFNALADNLVFKKPEKKSKTIVATSTPLVEATTAPEYVFQYLEEAELPTMSVNTNNEIETEPQKSTDVINQIEVYLKLILDNQNLMAQTINVIAENQTKIFHKLANLSVQIDDGFSTSNQTKKTDVVTLSESNSVYSETLVIKPIDSVKEIDTMESLLSDKKQKMKLLKQYSFICSRSAGRGATCAYKLLDIFFSREFLCKCSWSGGSRKTEEVKVGLKGYKNILNFFHELIRFWDETYTVEDNENFFKNVLKNSVKRKFSKNIRTSTKRMRMKKVALRNKNESDEENQDANQNKTDTDEKEIIENVENIIQTQETYQNKLDIEEEEEESLC